MVVLSYWTKHESPARDQFWKFSGQCSIFVPIDNQWIAILSPCILDKHSSKTKYTTTPSSIGPKVLMKSNNMIIITAYQFILAINFHINVIDSPEKGLQL